jgi:hypothetical protein
VKLSTFEVHPRNKRRPFEQGALDEFGNELSRRGRNCEDLGCPELDPQDPLQVDGRFNIDGRQWAIEHCRIAYDQEMVSAERYAKKELAAPLKAIAEEFEVVLHWVSIRPEEAGGSLRLSTSTTTCGSGREWPPSQAGMT